MIQQGDFPCANLPSDRRIQLLDIGFAQKKPHTETAVDSGTHPTLSFLM
jgi:hypothetical protein